MWYGYAFFMEEFYECNLRAYLMRVQTEPPINVAKDVFDQVSVFKGHIYIS